MREIQNRFSVMLKAGRGSQSQAECSERLGIIQQTYSRYEKGKIPDGETLLQIAMKLGTSTDELLGRTAKQAAFDTGVNLIDEALAEVQTIKEAIAALERKLKKMKP